MKRLSQAEYLEMFSGSDIREKALEQALDIRKFEIDLYWKRATYFWTLIGASLVGYGVANGVSAEQSHLAHRDGILLQCVIASLGLLFSVGWALVNKGSKQWQENWENHVDLLECAVVGPLYKTVLRRPRPLGFLSKLRDIATGPAPYSVSSINQIISYYTVWFWVVLAGVAFAKAFEWDFPIQSHWPTLLLSPFLLALVAIPVFCKTHQGDHRNRAFVRRARIVKRLLPSMRERIESKLLAGNIGRRHRRRLKALLERHKD